MKKKPIPTRTVNYVVGTLIVLFIAFCYFITRVAPGGSQSVTITSISPFNADKALPPIDPIIPDSLPHHKYQRLMYEAQQSRKMKNGMVSSSWSVDFWLVGVVVQKRCDTCTSTAAYWDSEGDKDYLIKLNWWKLDTGEYHNSVVYYVKNGQSFLRKNICEETKKGNVWESSCNETETPVSFRVDERTKSMMIPLSKTTFDICQPIVLVIGMGGALLIFYFMLNTFLVILVEIRNGNPFSEQNVLRFRFLAVVCFLMPVVAFLMNLLMWLIFSRYFTPDIKLSSDAWYIFWKPFVLGVIFAALYVAFKQGKKLKDEQDLTV